MILRRVFGRKFKPAFSGCAQHACGLTGLHDLGLIAKKRLNQATGREELGFEMYVGGGLGAVPYQAKLFDEFVAPEELLPLAQAIARVFARHGEKKNRNRARIKFLIQDLGIEKFPQSGRLSGELIAFRLFRGLTADAELYSLGLGTFFVCAVPFHSDRNLFQLTRARLVVFRVSPFRNAPGR